MIGTKIAGLRTAKGLSQTALAKRLQISTSAVGMYEQGRRTPSLEMVVRLAKEFQVSCDYLLMGEDPAPSQNPLRCRPGPKPKNTRL
jgi:transcriptional regulator with XRE-family HTH domain